MALCARTVYAVVHKSFALSALYGSHRTRARRNAHYTRSDIAPTFGVHVRGAIPDACPRNAVRGGYDYSQGGHRSDCPRVPRRCPAVLGCTPLECLHYSAGVPPCQPLFQKNFSSCFFKDNENARARMGSQNRLKQAKTWVLNAEKFSEKIRKSAQKRFSRRAAPLFFENSALCPALSRSLSRRSTEDRYTSTMLRK